MVGTSIYPLFGVKQEPSSTDNSKCFYKRNNNEKDLLLYRTEPIFPMLSVLFQSKKISNDQELIQSDPTSCPQNQKGNN